MEWDEKKAEEIVKKHKNRFSLRLTLKIVRVIVGIMIVYTIYMVILNISYDFSNFGKRIEHYQKLAIDWTNPELTTEVGVGHTHEITPLLTQKIDIPLIRTVGKKEYIVSELHLSKPIFKMFTQTEIDGLNMDYLNNKDRFYFNLPYDPRTDKKLDGDDSEATWETLDMIHEGHVADIALSLDNFYTPEEVTELIAPYDLSITWMPIYMGELIGYEEGGWSGSENSIAIQQPWGLSGGREVSDDYNSGSLLNAITKEQVHESEAMMIDNMEKMLTDKKRLAEQLLGTLHLQERYEYLQENGFQAYGAVITGPVKELLKLKEVEQIHSVQLGEIKYWNWND